MSIIMRCSQRYVFIISDVSPNTGGIIRDCLTTMKMSVMCMQTKQKIKNVMYSLLILNIKSMQVA